MAMDQHGNGGPTHGDGNLESAEALGMHLSNVTDELAQKFNLGDDHKGALITSVVPHTLAAKNGLMPGDLITRVGGKTVDDATEAADALSKGDPKKGIRLYITNSEGSRFIFLQDQ